MPSRHLDPEQSRRYAEHRYDFSRKSLAGRVVLVPGGAGGLGAAIAALLVQDGAIPVVGYRSNKGNALAFQQRLQDLYGGLVHLVEGDVADPEARGRYIEAALAVKGELYGVVALTGDPARVKGGEIDGAGPPRLLHRELRGAGAPRPGGRRGDGAPRHPRVDRARLEHAGRLPLRGEPRLRLAQGGAAARRAHPGQGVRGQGRRPGQRDRAGRDRRGDGARVDRRRASTTPTWTGGSSPASGGPRTWPGPCASCSSPTRT